MALERKSVHNYETYPLGTYFLSSIRGKKTFKHPHPYRYIDLDVTSSAFITKLSRLRIEIHFPKRYFNHHQHKSA